MCRVRTSLAVLCVIAIAAPALAAKPKPPKRTGAFCEPLPPGTASISVEGRNYTGTAIHDFTIWLVGADGAKISGVTVSSSQNGGADDWDVDDDGDGASQETGEKDDVDSSPGRSTRVDCKGDGKNNAGQRETPPQNSKGKSIKKGKNFKITVTLNPVSTDGGMICFAPTNKTGGIITSGTTTRYTIVADLNTYEYNSDHPFANVTSCPINQTGGIITGLEFQTTGDYNLLYVEEIDPNGDTLMMSDCGGPSCFLELSEPVMPGADVRFTATFDHFSDTDVTLLHVMPIVEYGVPTGACCLPDGDCMELTFIDECFNLGGFYMGDDVPCIDVYCEPTPTGACVFEDGDCYSGFNDFECVAADGEYLGDFVLCPVPVGDVDDDGDVDLADLAALLASYDACDGDPNYNPAADFDFDGCVTLSDLAALLGVFGT